jgi:drug/metabolite transporter (DMT)-like permease
MFWAILAGFGACANSAYYIVNRKFLQSIEPDLLAAAGFLFTSFFLLVAAGVRGIPDLGPDFLTSVAATSAINVAGTTLIFRALKTTDISLAVPMLCFTPLFLILTAAVMLGEMPSAIGMAGIFVIVSGSYILNTAAEHERLSDPFRAMFSHPGILSMLAVAFLYAISTGFDKLVVLNSDPVFGSGVVFGVLGSAFLFIFLVRQRGGSRQSLSGAAGGPPCSVNPRANRVHDIVIAGVAIGCIVTVEAVAINEAYLLQIVPYVIAIKRLSIVLTVLYGTIVIREEEIGRRVAGAGLMVGGAILILLFP